MLLMPRTTFGLLDIIGRLSHDSKILGQDASRKLPAERNANIRILSLSQSGGWFGLVEVIVTLTTNSD